ncbi:MAG TPA: XdhC family protein [Stellaceae bacterium]|nr:XdhC family protein [Stellaceae bacterium]
MKLAFLERALAASREGRSAALMTELKTGRQSFVEGATASGDLALDDGLREALRRCQAEDRNGTVETAHGPVFIEVFNPRLRCLVVGAVHIAQSLARMAALAGYVVTIVDPRTAFASGERFPNVELSTEWPDEALERLKPNRRTAVVTLTHDPKLDDPALATALRSDAFYIGALGSKRTHAARLKRLAELGFTDADFARIHGPVGLDIGSISPAEIAVSILAQMTLVLRGERRSKAKAA